MRRYSLFTVLLLCVAIVGVDAITFYWLQSITQLIPSPTLKLLIDILFWTFTIGLVTVILLLKIRMETVPVTKRQSLISSLYGLTVASFVPKVIFVVSVSVLYFSNFYFFGSQSYLLIPIVGLFAGFLPFFVVLYAISKAVYRFKVYRTTIVDSRLPEAFEGLKIVHISDLHLGSFEYRYAILERAITMINKEDPDLILFTGDLVNNYAWELNGWENVFRKLKAKKGKYAVLGNHDYGDYSAWDSSKEKEKNFESIKGFFGDVGFRLLLNEGLALSKEGQQIAVIGVENWGLPPFRQDGKLEKALVSVGDIPFKILLTHDPSHWDAEVRVGTDIALTLSGHTHGMQAGVNLFGKQWSPIKYKYKQWAGLYRKGDQHLYVNRGLGWLGFPGRLGMRPEITCIQLKMNE